MRGRQHKNLGECYHGLRNGNATFNFHKEVAMEIDPLVTAATIQASAQASAWFWDNYGKELGSQAIGVLKTQWKKFNWPKASERYQSRVKDICSTMRILYKTETVPLDDHYVDLYVLDEKTADKWCGMDDLQSAFDESMSFTRQDKRESARSIIIRYDRLFIYGKPGSGKTTLLKYYASLAQQRELNKVPIFISLSDWSYSKKGINDYIVEQFEICGFPDARMFIDSLLGKGNALVLFDGLDEISEESGERDRILHEMDDFVKQYYRNKICITCRISASNYVFAGKEKFKYVEIADFSTEQVSAFARKWFNQNHQEGERFVTALSSEENRNLKELSQNPLLLGLLCIVFDNKHSFPPTRGEIYRDAIDGLLNVWDSQQGVRRDRIMEGLNGNKERDLLSKLAFYYFQRGEIFFDKEDLSRQVAKFLGEMLGNQKEIDGDKIIKAIDEHHGLLTKRAIHVYSFSHLTFQDYFAARYLVDHSSDDNLEKIFTQVTNSRWMEIYFLTANLLSNADKFFFYFLKSLKEMVTKDSTMLTVVKWANKVSADFHKTDKAIRARMGAVDTICKIEQFIRRTTSSIEEHDYNVADSFARLLNHELDVDIDRTDAIELIKAIIFRQPFTKQLSKKFKKIIQLSVQHSETFDTDPDYHPASYDENQARIQIRDNLIPMIEHAEKGLREAVSDLVDEFLPSDFHDAIATIDLPKFHPTQNEWRSFVSNVYAKTLGLQTGEKILNLSDVHIVQFEKYIKANWLLIECLKTAKVSSHSAIKDSLFSL